MIRRIACGLALLGALAAPAIAYDDATEARIRTLVDTAVGMQPERRSDAEACGQEEPAAVVAGPDGVGKRENGVLPPSSVVEDQSLADP